MVEQVVLPRVRVVDVIKTVHENSKTFQTSKVLQPEKEVGKSPKLQYDWDYQVTERCRLPNSEELAQPISRFTFDFPTRLPFSLYPRSSILWLTDPKV